MCIWKGGESDKKQGWGEEDTPHVKERWKEPFATVQTGNYGFCFMHSECKRVGQWG